MIIKQNLWLELLIDVSKWCSLNFLVGERKRSLIFSLKSIPFCLPTPVKEKHQIKFALFCDPRTQQTIFMPIFQRSKLWYRRHLRLPAWNLTWFEADRDGQPLVDVETRSWNQVNWSVLETSSCLWKDCDPGQPLIRLWERKRSNHRKMLCLWWWVVTNFGGNVHRIKSSYGCQITAVALASKHTIYRTSHPGSSTWLETWACAWDSTEKEDVHLLTPACSSELNKLPLGMDYSSRLGHRTLPSF